MSSTSSSTLVVVGADGMDLNAGPEFCPPPPPPPPPSGVPGQVPTLRINAAETAVSSRNRPFSNNGGNNPYEPPAAIQNAMMTKDKKPFTYTPGMGGKLDLSQIRSPRMARRVAKNANDEGIEGPPKSNSNVTVGEPRPLSNIYTQQQVAVPVFPTNISPLQQQHHQQPAPINPTPIASANNRLPFNAETKMGPMTTAGQQPMPLIISSRENSPPETPTTPVPQVTLAKAPTPWLQNKNKPQEELPEWAKRSSLLAASTSPGEVCGTLQQQQQQQQQQSSSPPLGQQSHAQERVIPIRIEDRPSVFTVKNDNGRHHQLKQQPQPSCHHQQRWGNGNAQSEISSDKYQQQEPFSKSQSSAGGTVVPVMIEDNVNNNRRYSPRVIVQRGTPPSPQTTSQGEPVQSRSFRVLQKITDTDAPEAAPAVDQTEGRKLRLNENDKILMNKLKERVDGDGTYLHQEEDPRYRGAAIPSRAFRYLQNMTDSGNLSTTTAVAAPRSSGAAINKRQNINSPLFEESQANLPASEQQAPEPKKYTGSAIPSRSFRILQAMTSPESIGPDQTDY